MKSKKQKRQEARDRRLGNIKQYQKELQATQVPALKERIEKKILKAQTDIDNITKKIGA